MFATILLTLSLAHAEPLPEQYKYIPDPGTSFALSFAVGGGSGHFYSRRGDLGTFFLGAEVLTAALAIQGMQTQDQNEAVIGVTAYTVVRLAEVISSVPVANQTRRKMIDARLQD